MVRPIVPRCAVVLACAVGLGVAGCAAREAAPPPRAHEPTSAPTAAPDSLARSLYPVEVVMDSQAALGLQEAQTSAIRAELQRAQGELVDLEWRLGGEKEALTKVLTVAHPDETAAVAAAERVVRLEGEIKIAHLKLLVRVKNQLSPAQQATLDRTR